MKAIGKKLTPVLKQMLVWLTADSPEKWQGLVNWIMANVELYNQGKILSNHKSEMHVWTLFPYFRIGRWGTQRGTGGALGQSPCQAPWLGDTGKVFKHGDAKAYDNNLHVWYSVPTLSLVTERAPNCSFAFPFPSVVFWLQPETVLGYGSLSWSVTSAS